MAEKTLHVGMIVCGSGLAGVVDHLGNSHRVLPGSQVRKLKLRFKTFGTFLLNIEQWSTQRGKARKIVTHSPRNV